ncbi:hypothetical protein ACQZV8_18730, partial [Magnetococcales bacterium HHB-1]
DYRLFYADAFHTGGGGNLNYGAFMGHHILRGEGPLIASGEVPWHRMPGYGFIYALAGFLTSPQPLNMIETTLHALFLQIVLTAMALAFFFRSASSVFSPVAVLLISVLIAALPSQVYYIQIETVMPMVVLLLLAFSCRYLKKEQSGEVSFKEVFWLHGAFALWLSLRPDILPAWMLVSLFLHWRHPRFLLAPVLCFLAITLPWALFKYGYIGYFSLTSSSGGASFMAGLWEVPHKFIWTASDESYSIWAKSQGLAYDAKEGYALAMSEVVRFWVTYPGYMISLIWHELNNYAFWQAFPGTNPGLLLVDHKLLAWINQRMLIPGLWLVMILSFFTGYKRRQTFLLGFPVFLIMPIFFLTYSSSGRFYNVVSPALFTASFLLLLDKGFYQRLLKHPKLVVGSALLALLFMKFGPALDRYLLSWDEFRYWAPFLDPEQSTFYQIKAGL